MEFNVIDERYIISADVGHGGYATVFLAFDQIRRKQVAIKVINCDINNDKKAYNMFQQEAMTMAAISNLNVVSIYGSGIYNNKPYLVMDYVRGKSLKDIIRENSYLLVDEVYTYMMQIINGLEACHNCNIVHRDIKPQNIIKKTDGNVVLIDFGTAYIGEVERNLYVEDGAIIIGTIQLLAPELLKGDEKASARSDIYALGITMYDMFTGKYPFDSTDKPTVAKMHLFSPFPSVRKLNPSVPVEFENIIYKCCEKDPSLRYQNVNELRVDLMIAYENYKNPKKKKKSFFSWLFKK